MTRKQRFDLRKPEEAAAYLEHQRDAIGRRRLYNKRCLECGSEFIGWARALYCNPNCRQRHFYWKNRGARGSDD